MIQQFQNRNNNTGTNRNRKLVPEAKQALDQMKFEIAGQLGINLQQGYNGNISAKDAGRIGGNMVKKMIEQQQRQMAGQQ
ncbi:alpha/beta-type small acid-soluble spore protein [Caldicoprobacter faecalis]|uniref:Small, acid-soluble spore protein, alpha/beta type n=1 Tax=Caldicoprobacter faecalis TaxID=937334 RepID=A0A1I5TTE0_9FIRM|nr:alpha/beta-type small acid-soluble spore protein [Caldicoprobacter faecalis]PZN12016.1 MAG: small acid-soluble spore protein [Caldicoprobacter oshimai]SFP86171.1 Small, acid-soluble spore protein, alpha/beta type [Caldicoprobacter faecalis]